jgi:hypothetical protein
MVQICAVCGAEHTISFDRGGQKAKTGAVALKRGDTLVIRVDDAAPTTLTFKAGDFADFAHVTAAELAAKLNTATSALRARDDHGGLLIESATTGEASRIQIDGGTARVALGFPVDGTTDPCVGRPLLGVSVGADRLCDPNVIALRRCNDCGANECLMRTFDVAPKSLAGTHFAEHRKVVNALAEHCKASGWSHPHVADDHAAETSNPPDLDTEFPHRPCVLPHFVHARSAASRAAEEPR